MDKTNAVLVRIMHVHFAITPALISRFQSNDDAFGLELFVEVINTFHSDKDRAAGYSISGKRGKMEFNVVTRQTHVARISAAKRPIRKRLLKAETSTVKLFRLG